MLTNVKPRGFGFKLGSLADNTSKATTKKSESKSRVVKKQYRKLINKGTAPIDKSFRIHNFFKKGDVSIVNYEKDISVFIPPQTFNQKDEVFINNRKNKPYPAVADIANNLYKELHPNIEISPKQKKRIYKGFYNLFTHQRKSYLGYTLEYKDAEIGVPASTSNEKGLGVMESNQVANFFKNNNTNLILDIITGFYQKYFSSLVPVWLNFKKTYCSNRTISIVPVSIKKLEIDHFPTSLKRAKKHLKDNASIYYKVCLFFLLNPISDHDYNTKGITKLEEHHMIPEHLANHYPHLKPYINERFNKIKVCWIQHYFLHFLRYLEFRSQADYQSINLMYNYAVDLCEEDSTSQAMNQNQIIFDLFIKMKSWLDNQTVEEKLNSDTGSRERLRKQQNPEIQTLYREKNLIWKNRLYTDMPDLKIPAGSLQLHTDTVSRLRNHMSKFLTSHPEVKKPNNYETVHDRNLSGYISRHLRYQFTDQKNRYSVAFWGFFVEFSP